MARRTKGPSIAVVGEAYYALPCPYCGMPSIVLEDRRGRPFTRCMTCDARSFGTHAGIELAKNAGRFRYITSWPPTEWDGGDVAGGEQVG